MADDTTIYALWAFLGIASFCYFFGTQRIMIALQNMFGGEKKVVDERVYESDTSQTSFYDVPEYGLLPFVSMQRISSKQINGKFHTQYNYVFGEEGKEITIPFWDDDWKEDNPHTSGPRLFRLRNKDENEVKLKETIDRQKNDNDALQDEVNRYRKSRKLMEMEDAEHYGEMVKKLRPITIYNKHGENVGEQSGVVEGGGDHAD